MHHSKGMTLIEVMLTLAIVSLLTVSSLNVTINLAAAQRGDRRTHDAAATDVQLRELFRIDLAHAHACAITEAGLRFRTRAILDENLEVRHLPAVIGYEVRRIAERQWLVRTQTCSSGRRTMTELVCPDVRTVSLKSTGDAPRPDLQEIQWHGVPQTPTVVVEFENRPSSPVEFSHTGG